MANQEQPINAADYEAIGCATCRRAIYRKDADGDGNCADCHVTTPAPPEEATPVVPSRKEEPKA